MGPDTRAERLKRLQQQLADIAAEGARLRREAEERRPIEWPELPKPVKLTPKSGVAQRKRARPAKPPRGRPH
jgi:hypothetical protein